MVRYAVLAVFFALAPPAVSATPPPDPQHFVWRVRNLPVPFYLVGSIHNLTRRDYPLPDIYNRALADSQRLVFEYNPRQRAALTRKFGEVACYPAGQDIESEVRPATLALLKKNAWRYRIKFEQMRKLRPWAIALRLLAEEGPVGASSPDSVDSYLSRQAQRAGKEVAGLETVDEHVAFWREMLERDGENFLLYTLTRKETVGRLFDKTRDAWKNGDVTALAAANARLRKANPGIARKLLDRRNARWVARIEAEMKTGRPTAIVAGAGHFTGPRSVLQLLRERGYRIERL
ncbi:MAG: TraB/GumN family protein [Chthoniobacterales bacterium]|nr:TraB/GumN family protein [Chthoniobacterales bacterium]